MATKTSPRALAERQRKHLARAGFTAADIDAFVRTMATQPQPALDLPSETTR